ncbi:DUF4164 family protein [Lichenifustis flavocetrariae]|uniref:DUF4164 domain-containing protein n=1 Tax=Lichenifustis flavocetrariae TaxID=2949735 RepID=A0AA41YTS2_9HYPH|nr:DUF4164 family protein [Lichenifustis flavocetrariae]MCW6506877.1 DUF4164 domain-containing protein [Lichenifustis flavocetrariae]
MALPDRLHNAVKSLTSALDLLDAAVERRMQADAARGDLEQELSVMAEDRARLADDLDRALTKTERVERANRAVAERLDRMSEACTALLDQAPPEEPPQP